MNQTPKEKMRFRAHESFFIRKGWLSKGMRHVLRDPAVFKGSNDNPMDVLGLGSNRVKALRYWLQATGLTEEPRELRRDQRLTRLGQIIYENDPYMEELGSLWLAHYRLASNLRDATAWYYFFNEFQLNEFSKDDFLTQLGSYVRLQGGEVSPRSLEDDFNCILSTYLPHSKGAQEIDPESNIDCPLRELGLISVVSKRTRTYRKSPPLKHALHPLIVLAVLLDRTGGTKEVKISALQNAPCNVGKMFNLDTITLLDLLYKIELLGHIKVERTAGLDLVRIKTEMGFLDCVQAYYRTIGE